MVEKKRCKENSLVCPYKKAGFNKLTSYGGFFSGNEMEKCKVEIENLFSGKMKWGNIRLTLKNFFRGKCKVDIENLFSGNDEMKFI